MLLDGLYNVRKVLLQQQNHLLTMEQQKYVMTRDFLVASTRNVRLVGTANFLVAATKCYIGCT